MTQNRNHLVNALVLYKVISALGDYVAFVTYCITSGSVCGAVEKNTVHRTTALLRVGQIRIISFNVLLSIVFWEIGFTIK